MEWYEILSICGIPTLGALTVSYIFNIVVNGGKKKREVKNKRDKTIDGLPITIEEMNSKIDKILNNANNQDIKITVLSLGLQALLRDRLLGMYNECISKGYAKITTKDNFENIYNQYHQLGANGVLDSVREKFLDLPEEPGK